MARRKTKAVWAGRVGIGGDSPVSVQSMLNAPPGDAAENVRQARRLEKAGCDIVRVAVPDRAAVKLIPALKEAVGMPVVADIHFNYRLALEAVAAGADKIRLNPGNIGGDDRVKAVALACRGRNVPIRIGVNSGSLQKQILAKYGAPTAEALCESALSHARLLNRFDFDDIVVSIKSSDVRTMVEASALLAGRCDYPLHLGVTEAGFGEAAVVKSAVGIGSLLTRGIGDTIRVSLTDRPEEEIAAAKEILRACGLLRDSIEWISCPTCGRTKIDLIALTREAKARFGSVKKPLKVAIMGCAVNGPGEAREADVGIAGGDGCGILFRHGEILRKVPEGRLLDELGKEIDKL